MGMQFCLKEILINYSNNEKKKTKTKKHGSEHIQVMKNYVVFLCLFYIELNKNEKSTTIK